MIRNWAELPLKNPEWEEEARRIVGDNQLPDVFFIGVSTSYQKVVSVPGEANEFDYHSDVKPAEGRIVGRFTDLDEAIDFFNQIKPSVSGHIGSVSLNDRLEGEVLHKYVQVDAFGYSRSFQDGDIRWVRTAIENRAASYAAELEQLGDELKEDAPSPALVARTLGILKDELDSWNEGEEMDSAIGGGEFSGGYFTPETLAAILIKKLRESGWEGSLEEYVDYAGSILGWRNIMRKYGDLLQFSELGQRYAYEADYKQYYLRAPAHRKKVADEIEPLSDEIRATSEAVERLVRA